MRISVGFVLLCITALLLPSQAIGHGGHMHRSGEFSGDLGVAGSALRAEASAAGARASSEAPAWCGPVLRRDDRAHAVFGRLPTIKVIYAYPAGRASRFRHFARLLQANVSGLAAFLGGQSGYRKTVRFDMGTSCGPQYVDIQLLRLGAGPATTGSGIRARSPPRWTPARPSAARSAGPPGVSARSSTSYMPTG